MKICQFVFNLLGGGGGTHGHDTVNLKVDLEETSVSEMEWLVSGQGQTDGFCYHSDEPLYFVT
jgi:hypothetical protein